MNERLPECAEVRELAPELALGIVSGPERAVALAHLDGCAGCRTLVEDLAGTTDALVLLGPHAEPPAGFESRVLERLHGTPHRRNRRELAAWILAAACVLALVGVIVGRDGGASDGELAVMRSAAGLELGEAFLYPGHDDHPAWIYLSMPGWAEWVEEHGGGSDTYWLRIERHDGGEQLVEAQSLGAGRDGWAGPIESDPDEIASVAVVDGDGRVICSAST